MAELQKDKQRLDWLCQCTAGQWESLNNIRLSLVTGSLRRAVDVMIEQDL